MQQQNNPKPSKRLTSTGRPRWRANPPVRPSGCSQLLPLRGAVTVPQTDGALNPQAGQPGLHTAWADYPPGGPSRRTIAQSAAGLSLSRAICKGRSACLGFSRRYKQLPAHLQTLSPSQTSLTCLGFFRGLILGHLKPAFPANHFPPSAQYNSSGRRPGVRRLDRG